MIEEIQKSSKNKIYELKWIHSATKDMHGALVVLGLWLKFQLYFTYWFHGKNFHGNTV